MKRTLLALLAVAVFVPLAVAAAQGPEEYDKCYLSAGHLRVSHDVKRIDHVAFEGLDIGTIDGENSTVDDLDFHNVKAKNVQLPNAQIERMSVGRARIERLVAYDAKIREVAK